MDQARSVTFCLRRVSHCRGRAEQRGQRLRGPQRQHREEGTIIISILQVRECIRRLQVVKLEFDADRLPQSVLQPLWPPPNRWKSLVNPPPKGQPLLIPQVRLGRGVTHSLTKMKRAYTVFG